MDADYRIMFLNDLSYLTFKIVYEDLGELVGE
jgi:hypothetical protein